MAQSKGSLLHQQALTVAGLFTGLMLTSLVLVLNSPGTYRIPFGPLSGPQYLATVVTYIGVVGAMSSSSMLALLEIGGGLAQTHGVVDQLGTSLFLASVFGFLGILPLLLAPFTQTGAAVVLAAEIVLLSTYFVGRRIAPAPPVP